MQVRYSDEIYGVGPNGHQTGGTAALRQRSRSRSGPRLHQQENSEMYYGVSLSNATHDQGHVSGQMIQTNISPHMNMSPSVHNPYPATGVVAPGPIANQQTLNERRDNEQRTMMRIATAEIDELKDDLKHAEQMLAKSLHEKETA